MRFRKLCIQLIMNAIMMDILTTIRSYNSYPSVASSSLKGFRFWYISGNLPLGDPQSCKGRNTCRGVYFARFSWIFFLNEWFIIYFWKLVYDLFIFSNNTNFFFNFNYSKWPMYTTSFWESRSETSRSADIVASVLLIWK